MLRTNVNSASLLATEPLSAVSHGRTLSRIIQNVPPSPTIAAADRAQQLKAQGRDIVSFTVGEPDFDTPAHIRRAAVEALEKGLTRYTAAQGILPLRQVIAEKVRRDQGVEVSPKQVVVTNGGKQALAAAFAVLLDPGDEVVIPAPYWTSYPDMVRLVDGVPVIVETTPGSGYLMTPEQLLSACTPRTKVIVLNTPSNPTGACYGEEELRQLAAAFRTVRGHERITIISDEVYEYITFDGFEHRSILTIAPELVDNVLLVNAFSKSYAMTGWRVGYAVGPQDIIDAMAVHQSQFTSNVCSIAQHAAVSAYEDAYAFPRMMRESFQERLDLVCDAVNQMEGVRLTPKPRGAFYAFLELGGLVGRSVGGVTIRTGSDFANLLLEKYDVVAVQGEAFGAPTAIRLSFAMAKPQLEKGLDRIAAACRSLS